MRSAGSSRSARRASGARIPAFQLTQRSRKLTGLSAALFDFFAWNGAYDLWDYRIPYALLTMVSATVIAGAGSWALTRALVPTGVLDRFAAGRDRALV